MNIIWHLLVATPFSNPHLTIGWNYWIVPPLLSHYTPSWLSPTLSSLLHHY